MSAAIATSAAILKALAPRMIIGSNISHSPFLVGQAGMPAMLIRKYISEWQRSFGPKLRECPLIACEATFPIRRGLPNKSYAIKRERAEMVRTFDDSLRFIATLGHAL